MTIQVRVALSGPGGSGKTYAVSKTREFLESLGFKVGVVPSSMRHLASIGYKNNQGGDWQSQMASAIFRQIQQREMAQQDFDFILADRAMSCVLGYTQQILEENFNQVDNLFKDLQERETMSNLLSARDMTRSLWAEDSIDYWDAVLFKEIHPDYPPTNDGMGRVDDLEWHISSQQKIRDAYFLHWGEMLPADRDDAALVLQKTCLSIYSDKQEKTTEADHLPVEEIFGDSLVEGVS